MAKEVGFPFAVQVDNAAAALQTISNDVTNFNFSTPRGVQDVTGVDKSAMERLLLLADFSVTLNGVFNDAAGDSHSVFSDLDGVRTCTLAISGQTLSTESLFTDYALTRNQDGSLTWSAPGVLADGTVPTWT
jgi:hypothetical protein